MQLKYPNSIYTYVCLKCGRKGKAPFFKRINWNGPGFKTFTDKCRGQCTMAMPNGQCAYTKHIIIKKEKKWKED